jgi:poly-gamma-glutamate synthesis protein (capsule biosynthesis protein)
MTPEHAASKGFREIQALSPDWVPNFDSLYNFPPDSRETIIVRADLAANGVRELSLYPALINDEAQAEVLAPSDARFRDVVDYLKWCCDEAGCAVEFRRNGDRVGVTAGTAADQRSVKVV